MKLRPSCSPWVKTLAWAALLLTMMGSSCASDLKNSAHAGALDFVEGAVETALENLVPVGQLFAQ